ncbi:hypothetical protein PAPYR_5922 [Paratrimastix pyriformis]|uniref:RanBP2-type domain-containing protein n=1 Tax=Paratrimastix pyriformis TaxID=342808 RepID=A0ABQ8UGJ2_9EUKA|nr:hypothetical protein PAPYR_5922 [Paratrimastix pyriformis]
MQGKRNKKTASKEPQAPPPPTHSARSPRIFLPHHTHAYRRPFLHIIVLFGQDPKVQRYSHEVCEEFLDNSVDVCLQTEHLGQSIKPPVLADVISQCQADYLIVLGDRNLRNGSCHCQIQGKLVEKPISERIREILQEWIDAGKGDPRESSRGIEVAELTDEMLFEILQFYTALRKVRERLATVLEETHELKQSRSLRDPDKDTQKQVAKTQSSSIHLHRDLHAARASVEAMTVVPDPVTTPGARLRGQIVGPTGPTHDDIPPASLPSSLKERLVSFAGSALAQVEEVGSALAECPAAASLWRAYMNQLEEARKPQATDPSAEWSCPTCTFLNPATAARCEICSRSRPGVSESPPEDDGAEWTVTGSSSRRRTNKAQQIAQQAAAQAAVATAAHRVRMAGGDVGCE